MLKVEQRQSHFKLLWYTVTDSKMVMQTQTADSLCQVEFEK